MRDRLYRIIFVFIIVVLLSFAVVFIVANAQGAGNCNSGWTAKDEDAPYKYDGSEIITKVIVKSGLGCFVFLRDGSNGCYTINGLGTTSVTARLAGTEGPSCQAISHVEFYSGEPIPPTSTPTDGVINRNTPTPTNATPFKFWTFTPSPTYPPPHTPTPPTATMTLPPGVTPTVTPPDTLPPPPPRKTKTPQVILPMTGEDGSGEDHTSEWIGVISFAIFMVYMIARQWIRSRER